MHSNVKVWNKNKYDFSQDYKGEVISIAAGKYIEMDWDEAVEFKSTFYPPTYDGAGVQKAESYKMISIEGKPPHLGQDWVVCQACGDKFTTETELESHIDKNHLDDLDDQKLATKRKAKK